MNSCVDRLRRRENRIALSIGIFVLQDTTFIQLFVHIFAHAPAGVKEVEHILHVEAELQVVIGVAYVEAEVMLVGEVDAVYPRAVDAVCLGKFALMILQVVAAVYKVHEAHSVVLADEAEVAFGHLLVKTLEAAGIETKGILLDVDVFTTLAFVSLDASGNRDFSFARKPGADTCLRPEEVDEALLASARVFHFGTLSLTDEPAASATRKAIELSRKHDLLISLDPNIRKPLWKREEDAKAAIEWSLRQADIVKISDEKAPGGIRRIPDLHHPGAQGLPGGHAERFRDCGQPCRHPCGGHHRRGRHLWRQRHEPTPAMREGPGGAHGGRADPDRQFRLHRRKPVDANARRDRQRSGVFGCGPENERVTGL